MANANVAIGLRPVNQNGTAWTGQGQMVCFLASNASNIFLGDPLVAVGGTDAFGVPLVGLASAGAGNPILGSMLGRCNGPQGAQSTLLRGDTVYRPGSTLSYAMMINDPDNYYVVQEDSVGGAISAALAGYANGNLVAGAGNTVTGFSGWQLQSSSVIASANPTYQVKIMGLARGPDNALGTNADWIVVLNNPQFGSNVGV